MQAVERLQFSVHQLFLDQLAKLKVSWNNLWTKYLIRMFARVNARKRSNRINERTHTLEIHYWSFWNFIFFFNMESLIIF